MRTQGPSSRSIPILYVCNSCARRLRQTSLFSPCSLRNLTSHATTTATTAKTIHHDPSTLAPSPDPPPVLQTNPKPRLHLPDNALAYRWDTLPPSPSQLTYADSFFLAHAPKLLWSAAKFRTISFGSSAPLPEVAFLGRSNVGKSSLLNAVLQRKISHTSSKPGRTRTMNAFGVGGEDGRGNEARVVVLDMPGYGKGSREEWGREILKYLVGRRELRRAFILVDAEHGVKASDEQLLAMFRHNAIPHQVILSKVDKILLPGSKYPSPDGLVRRFSELRNTFEKVRDIVQPQARDGPPALGEILTCSAEKSLEAGKKLGVSGIRWAVLSAVGLEDPRKVSANVRVADEQDQRQHEDQDQYDDIP